MSTFTIQPFGTVYQDWARGFMTATWGTTQQVSRGTLYNVLDYPGFVAVVEGNPRGLLTYRVDGVQCEVLMIHSAVTELGVGSALISSAADAARRGGCRRLWLITTNDNIHAFRWYQKRGFTIAAVHVNAVAKSRNLKPEIPLIGADDIPLRDEIEFEMMLT